jgi:enterochelin esterase-like enzyme
MLSSLILCSYVFQKTLPIFIPAYYRFFSLNLSHTKILGYEKLYSPLHRRAFVLPGNNIATAQPHGKVYEREIIKSNIMNKNVAYTVYLPADYETSSRTYPVVYLLHGYTDDNTGWLQFGEVNRYADKAIAEGTIPPMIIIMPNGDSSFYINSYDGKENYEDFFVKEFMPAVEKKYRIKAEKKFRGVAGLSMGGYGTLIYALKHPELFAAAAPFSAAVWDDDASLLCLMPAGQERWASYSVAT